MCPSSFIHLFVCFFRLFCKVDLHIGIVLLGSIQKYKYTAGRPVAKELSVVFRLRKFKIFLDISDHLMLRTCYVDRSIITTNNTKYIYQNNI